MNLVANHQETRLRDLGVLSKQIMGEEKQLTHEREPLVKVAKVMFGDEVWTNRLYFWYLS